MTDRFISFRHKMCRVALLALIPGTLGFLVARNHTNLDIQPAQSLNLEGLEIPQTTIDIGTVWSGAKNIQREFTLTNRTGHQIRIDSVESDCGCTVPEIFSRDVDNGQSTKLRIAFWPPALGTDHGVEFRRTISVTVDTIKGRKSFRLFLTGLLEPDESLRVFPVNVDVETPAKGTTLHFKGSETLLNSIPAKLVVTPNQDQRILVQMPQPGQNEAIGFKDVDVVIRRASNPNCTGQWRSAIEFAPDAVSEGLTIHLTGHASQCVVATPSCLLLTDDPAGREATIQLAAEIGSPIVESASSRLPLTLYLAGTVSRPNGRIRTLRVQVRGRLSGNASGTIRIHVRSASGPSEMISIPVVLLQQANPATPNS
jgi:Protein of unknown function (DUF1573)